MATTTSPHYRHHFHGHAESRADSYLVPAGRVLFALIFLQTVPMHFSEAGIQYAAAHGVPAAGLLVPLSGVMAFVGGLSVALGYYARVGALLLALFLLLSASGDLLVPLLGRAAGPFDYLHEFAHDGRHLLGVPCH